MRGILFFRRQIYDFPLKLQIKLSTGEKFFDIRKWVSSFWQLIVKGIIILIAILIDTQKGGNGILRSFIKNNNKRVH